MGYFLKKTRNKKGLYLQIYESHWDPQKGHTVNKSVRAVGYEHELRESGIADPIAHFKDEVARMNEERKASLEATKASEISDIPPVRHLGHFAIKAIDDALGTAADLALLQLPSGLPFSLADLLPSLVYARAVAPCSKTGTFHDVLPLMEGVESTFSLDQLCDGLSYLGEEYEKVIEAYNARVAKSFGHDTSATYLYHTNLYFEAGREDPYKEPESMVSIGLLLDADCVPMGMSVLPGNEGARLQPEEVTSLHRERNAVEGRTVRAANRLLNCADAVNAGDGYLFSNSLETLEDTELAWALSPDGWHDVVDERGGLLWRYKETVGDFTYKVEGPDGKHRDRTFREKRVMTYNSNPTTGYDMLVTSETKMGAREIYSAYHNLQEIEESFLAMEPELDAQPAFLQRQSTVTGYLLVCYLTVLLLRLLQVHVLGDKFSTKDVIDLCRGLNVVRASERKYVNISKRTPLIEELAKRTGLPLLKLDLNKGDVRSIANCSLAQLPSTNEPSSPAKKRSSKRS
ncbi:MAG: hypothetical protein Q4B54_06385 [Coriobacteriales bacterium]|nr:hypothetical protein [Coriobacteriales bacterium]